jgi:3-isopropylmalate/(R)-2-methylmalate dehydratase small subunit
MNKEFTWQLKGKCHKLGHDFAHDGPMMNFKFVMDRVTDPAVLIPHLFAESDPGFKDRVKPGDIIVAGRNLGKGKAHVQAYVAMQGLGLGVLCESMPFLTYRGAIASGLLLMAECKGVSECAETGDELEVDFLTGKFVNRTRNITREFPPVPEGLRDTIRLGGTKGVLKAWWEKEKVKA